MSVVGSVVGSVAASVADSVVTPGACARPSPPRIGIAGAGAIGCSLAAQFAAAGNPVSVLARGAALTAIRDDGIHWTSAIRGTSVAQVAASDDAAELGVQDLVFVCVKAHDLAAVLPKLTPWIGPETLIVPTVNGVPWWYFHGEAGRFKDQPVRAVDPHGLLSQALPWRQLIGCVIFMTAELTGPARVVANNPDLMILGELDNQLSARLDWLRGVVAGTGIEARASDRIRDNLWVKIIANLTSNPLSVVAEATLEQIYREPTLKKVSGAMLHEVLALAAAYGARVAFDPLTFTEQGAAMGPVRTSMLQDYQRGRRLELAAIGDAVLEFAERFDFPMPVTRSVLAVAHFRDLQSKRS